MLIRGYNNSVVSFNNISIYQFLFFCFFLTINHISSRVSLHCIMIDQMNELPDDGMKSSPGTSRYKENKWISRKKN